MIQLTFRIQRAWVKNFVTTEYITCIRQSLTRGHKVKIKNLEVCITSFLDYSLGLFVGYIVLKDRCFQVRRKCVKRIVVCFTILLYGAGICLTVFKQVRTPFFT